MPGKIMLHRSSSRLAYLPVKKQDNQPLFVTTDQIKEEVQQRLFQKISVSKPNTKKRGIWQRIMKSETFEHLTTASLICNALWICIDTDLNKAETTLDSHIVFQLGENLFCAFFLFEWLAKALSWVDIISACLKDGWFVFDGVIVSLMVVETWILSSLMLIRGTSMRNSSASNASMLRMARLMRLSRLLRLGRLLRFMPELLIMLRGLKAAMRSVVYTIIFLTLFLFVAGILFTQLSMDTPLKEVYFPNIMSSMYFLLINGTLLLNTDAKSLELSTLGNLELSVAFFVVVVVSAVLMMNVLIGMLCQVISNVASSEREEIRIKTIRSTLEEVMHEIDDDNSGTVTRRKMNHILDLPRVEAKLCECGVNPKDLVNLSDWIFQSKELVLEESPVATTGGRNLYRQGTGDSLASATRHRSGTLSESVDSECSNQSPRNTRNRSKEGAETDSASSPGRPRDKQNRPKIGKRYYNRTDEGTDRELTLKDFIEVVLELRGSNLACQKNIMDLRRHIDTCVLENDLRIKNVQSAVDEVASRTKMLYYKLERDREVRRQRAMAMWPDKMQEFLAREEILDDSCEASCGVVLSACKNGTAGFARTGHGDEGFGVREASHVVKLGFSMDSLPAEVSFGDIKLDIEETLDTNGDEYMANGHGDLGEGLLNGSSRVGLDSAPGIIVPSCSVVHECSGDVYTDTSCLLGGFSPTKRPAQAQSWTEHRSDGIAAERTLAKRCCGDH
eukprot:TRINITY_DN92367_c0_g1_i1.p1 TRINITY_DN92367_c0_g1~~TRINITY_DN92367_c0_g1_i1.p1  ORF type:complete len:732 (-),score=150.07 TRINITY_DN92367_c0_g1_i1:136-2331(-)